MRNPAAPRAAGQDTLRSSGTPHALDTTVVPTPPFPGFYSSPYFSAADNKASAGLLPLAGDFNHDGKPDIVTFGEETICLRPGKGDGSFGDPILTTSQVTSFGNGPLRGPTYAATADLNGDGFPDLVAGDPSGLVVMLNQKNGTFGYGTKLVTPVASGNIDPSAIFAIAVGATTGSGHQDVLAVWTDSSQNTYIETFLNDGTGSFPATKITTYADPGSKLFTGPTVALADVNADGKLDLVIEKSLSTSVAVELAFGVGDGTFAPPQLTTSVTVPGSYTYSTNLLVASFTGDPSRQDILVSGPYGPYLAMSNGDGTYQQAKPALPNDPVAAAPGSPAEARSRIIGAQAADLNGDGKPDLILTVVGGLAAYLGNGDGTFSPVSGTASLSLNWWYVYFLGRNSYPRGFGNVATATQIIFADWDADGHTDFAFADAVFGYLGIVRGQGDGSFVTPHLLYSESSPQISPLAFYAATALDLNGDGISDLVGTNTLDGSVVTAISSGKGAFTFKEALPPITEGPNGTIQFSYLLPVKGDFNNDGKADLLRVGGNGSLDIILSNGDGTLHTPLVAPIPYPGVSCWYNSGPLVAAGDVNGDGNLDLVIGYPGDSACGPSSPPVPSGYYVALGAGDGTFDPGRITFVPFGNSVQAIAVAKLHGPGKPVDIVISDNTYDSQQGTSTNATSLLAGKGDGTFVPGPSVDSQHHIESILTDDYNGDGQPDLTLVSGDDPAGAQSGAGIFLLPGKGDGTFGSQSRLAGSVPSYSVQYADINGDGSLDLIMVPNGVQQTGGSLAGVSILLGDGKGNFASPIDYPSVGNRVLIGNFLGDNTLSMIGVGNDASGGFFMNQGGTALAVTPSSTTIPSGGTLTLAAALQPTLSNRPVPTGSVTLYDGTSSIATGTLSNGSYTFTAPALALGTHTLSVAYAGDANFQPNHSAPVSVTALATPPDYTISPSATSVTIARGSSGAVTLKLAANSGLNGAVTFACSGLPAEATCNFAPDTLTLAAGQSGSDTLTITTKAASPAAVSRVAETTQSPLPRGLALAGLLLLALPLRRYRAALLTLAVILVLGAATGLSGCGGGSGAKTPAPPVDPGTPAGASTVTVTATAIAGTATVTHALSLKLTVQ